MIWIGVVKDTSCQPEAVSLVKVAVARRVPVALHRLPTLRARVLVALVEPDPGDVAADRRAELDPDLQRLSVVHVREDRAAAAGPDGGHRRGRVLGRERPADVGGQRVPGDVGETTRPAAKGRGVGGGEGEAGRGIEGGGAGGRIPGHARGDDLCRRVAELDVGGVHRAGGERLAEGRGDVHAGGDAGGAGNGAGAGHGGRRGVRRVRIGLRGERPGDVGGERVARDVGDAARAAADERAYRWSEKARLAVGSRVAVRVFTF